MLHANAEPILGFRLRRRLGAGNFGEVWEAQAPNGQVVALKFIDSRSRDACALRTEVRILRAVSDIGHPNLIHLQSVYASFSSLVLCMERADGNLEELRETYRETTGRNVPPDHLLELLGQAADGLDYLAGLKLPGFNLASSGLQHCDVKPSNLLLLGDTVKIADFGLCAALGQRTHLKGWRGTLRYAAPEMYRGRASPTTDQFALAVAYCDLVAGERLLVLPEGANTGPFAPVDLNKVRTRERPVLARALSPDPTRRWPSCRSFINSLREVALPARPPKPSTRRISLSGLHRRLPT